MTWEELKEKAKELGYCFNDEHLWHFLCKGIDDDASILFYKGGSVCYKLDGEKASADIIIAQERTPDQMWQIMEALR